MCHMSAQTARGSGIGVVCCFLPEVLVGGNRHIRSFGLSRISLNSSFSCIAYMATADLA